MSRVLHTLEDGTTYMGDPSQPINFYAVKHNGEDIWANGSAYEAVTEYRNAPQGSRLVVTLWESDGDDAHLIGQQIDITDVVRHAIARGKL